MIVIAIPSLLIGTAVFVVAIWLLDRSGAQFRCLVRASLLEQANRELDVSRVNASQWVWSIVLIMVLFFGYLLGILPIAIALAVIWMLAPTWILSYQLHRRRMVMRDQLVSCTQSLANSARAGQSLSQGLQAVSEETAEPLGAELQRMMAQYQLGRPLAEVLIDTKTRLQIDSFSMFAATIVVSLERGGRVTESLERISRSLRENQRVERKLQAETAGGWKVVLILTLFPFLFLAGFYVLHPSGTLLMFQSWIGQLLTILILGLVVVSVWWSRKILNIEL